MSNQIVICPCSGLCNRLRVLFRYYQKAKDEKKKLVVIWKTDPSCPGYFPDYFQSLPNVKFYPDNSHNWTFDYKGYGSYNWNCSYPGLRLKPKIQRIVDSLIRTHLGSNYIAVHVRRTDHIRVARRYNMFTQDEQFFQFLNKRLDSKIFLATDNLDTQLQFQKRYSNKVVVYRQIRPRTHKRQTSLKHSIIDLYMCVQANQFMGSGHSSFSKLISQLRKEQMSVLVEKK